jgi:hypothetical protein
MTPMSGTLKERVLHHLGVEQAAPDLVFLELLARRYAQTVPWESASRIVKRRHSATPEAAVRWTEEFWESAIQHGTGGTCFESNRAFFALLTALGYNGHLTINNMQETIGCHTAIVVTLDGNPWLVDAGYPIYGALPLDPARQTERTTPYRSYRVEPRGNGEYEISHSPHPRPYMFNLIDRPVDDETYRAAAINDYGPQGLFLDRVILLKVVDGAVWRFDSNMQPAMVEEFRDGARREHPIEEAVPDALSRRIGVAAPIIEEALASLQTKSDEE